MDPVVIVFLLPPWEISSKGLGGKHNGPSARSIYSPIRNPRFYSTVELNKKQISKLELKAVCIEGRR